MLEILYEDRSLVIINKPPGLLVHRSMIASDVKEFALQLLRDQLGTHVHPAHRLDRKTSGALVFTKSKEALSYVRRQFEDLSVSKNYLAIVRGHTIGQATIDYPLKNEKEVLQEAVTHYSTIQHMEIPLPFGKHQTSRYSLIRCEPVTGRMHQLRKHFAHIMHPIIGDRPHGCNKQNKLFKERFQFTEMLLHSRGIKIQSPENEKRVEVEAPFFEEFVRVGKILGVDFQKA